MAEIRNLINRVDFNNLIYKFKDENLAPISFINLKVHYIFIKIQLRVIKL